MLKRHSDQSVRGKRPIRSRPPRNDTSKASRDFWDKADIIAKFLSSVVIAAIGILITWSIQTTQIKTNKEIAQSSLDAAQLKALDDRRLQESEITVALVEHLISKDPLQREIAVVALRSYSNSSAYDAIVQVLAKRDSDESVRRAAITQLAASTSAQVAKTLTSIALDEKKPIEERQLAVKANEQVALSAALGPETYVFAASNIEMRPAGADLDSGAFTQALLEGMNGDHADLNRDGKINATELASYLNTRIPAITGEKQHPEFSFPTGRVAPDLFTVEPTRQNVIAVVVGISQASPYLYSYKLPLHFAARDAKSFAAALEPRSKAVHLLTNEESDKLRVLQSLRAAAAEANQDSVLIFYFAGYAGSSKEHGSAWLLSDDSKLGIAEVRAELEKSPAKTKCIFVDSIAQGRVSPEDVGLDFQ